MSIERIDQMQSFQEGDLKKKQFYGSFQKSFE